MPIIITAVTKIGLKIEWQYPRRKDNFVALTTKKTIECFFISFMLYQEAVVMRTDDTDSLVIALDYKHFFNTLEIWLEAGV